MRELPEELLKSLEKEEGFNRKAFLEVHRRGERATAIRLNPFKPAELDFSLDRQVPWCPGAFYLTERPVFTLDPLFHAGCYYVQDPGSMFLEHAIHSVIGNILDFTVLDLCAAPGGKSTSLLSLLKNTGTLVSNEVIKGRIPALIDNVSRWGTNNSIVTNSEASRFGQAGALFDLLVIDAPCSGSGLFRKQPEAIDEWSPEAVQACCIRQKKILEDALPCLKAGGYLFYSTCSYSTEENENMVQQLIAEHDLEFLPIPLEAAWNVVFTGLGYRFYPHLTQTEGFFCALLKKPGTLIPGKSSKAVKTQVKDVPAMAGEFINLTGTDIFQQAQRLHTVTPPAKSIYQQVKDHLYIRKLGTTIGEVKGRDLVPAQELAWSTELTYKNRVDLDKEEAIQYLRKASFHAGETTPGLALITYRGQGIGWAKFMQGRVNNYLPQELRIRM